MQGRTRCRWMGLGGAALLALAAGLGCSGADEDDALGTGAGLGGAGLGGAGGTDSSSGGGELGGAPVGGEAGTSTGGEPGTTGGNASGGTAGLESCPPPPAGATAEELIALDTTNEARLAMGIDCQALIPELSLAAQNHCDYVALNAGDPTCGDQGHSEVEGCPGFTGTGPGARVTAAGYTGRGWSECMAFRGEPARAVMTFIDSVYHRTPVLSPWTRDMGYGFAERCDTINFGRGPTTSAEVTAHYPYAGQTGVPLQFRGDREGPEPPSPATGWPSGYPVTLFVQDYEVAAHRFLVASSGEELSHVWLDGSGTEGESSRVLYADLPLAPDTTYRVVIEGTRGGAPLNFDWTFTTGGG